MIIEPEKTSPCISHAANVVEQRNVRRNEFEIVLEAPEIANAALPGQFVMVVTGEGYGFEHRRPFSLFRADPETGRVSILYLARGIFTQDLAQKLPGDSVQLLGPLGTHFDTRADERIAIIASGGIGAPPLCFLARRLLEMPQPLRPERVIAICGARSSDYLVGVTELCSLGAEVDIVTDDGSEGAQGTVPEHLERLLKRYPEVTAAGVRVYGCGPMPMLLALTNVCERYGVTGQISIEAPMHCGVGQCDSCLIPVVGRDGKGPIRACVDGPVLPIGTYCWETPATP